MFLIHTTQKILRGLFPLLVLASTASAQNTNGSSALARFKSDYPAALTRLKQAYDHATASGTLTMISAVDSSGRGLKIDIKVSGKLKKVSVFSFFASSGGDPKPAYQFVNCIGQDATFTATRNFLKGNQFSISDVANIADAENDPLNTAFMQFNLMGGKFFFAIYGKDLFDIRDLLDEEKFRITEVKEEIEAGERVVKIQYTSNKKQGANVSSNGSAEFLPDRCWVLRRHALDTFSSIGTGANAPRKHMRFEMAAEYGDDQEGIPLLKQVKYVEPNGRGTKTSTLVFDKIDLGAETPDNEFTLAYYKLPDVLAPAADPSRSYTSYWIFGLSILALVAALVIRRRSQ